MRVRIILAVISIMTIFTSFSYPYKANVAYITDGDTIKVLSNETEIRIRLYGIDAPESSQNYGTASRSFLSNLIFDKTIELKVMDTDLYGRTVAIVYLGTNCVNERMIEAGFAWVYAYYCGQEILSNWNALEAKARAGRRGLWLDPRPTPPWTFRHYHSDR